MSESTNIWVRTAALEKAITGKSVKEVHRGLPTEVDDDEYIDWGWAYASLKQMNDKVIEVFVQDEEHPHHGVTTNLPPDSVKTGDVLMGNKYIDDEDAFNEEEDENMYPDDLITLTHLHEAEVVHCLRKRYAYDKIYTNTGPILLALNPFKNCKHLYSDKVMEEYWARGELAIQGIVDEDNPLEPHVYGIADRSFRKMLQTLEDQKSGGGARRTLKGSGPITDQSILVSGESGAGKTVTTKFIMQYLAKLSQRSSDAKTPTKKEEKSIEQQVLQSNPILESFGNARTIRNDNSSRFGKFIEIKFNHTGMLIGASIETYLLEKVRLVSQAEGERNYHIFYELFCMGDDKLEQYHLEIYNPEDFRMTNQSGTFDRRDGVQDFETYDDLTNAMRILGMTDDEQEGVFRIPSAALHGSNISFLATSNDESELDLNNLHLDPFVKLMGLEKENLQKALCFLKIKAGKEFHMRTLPKAKAEKGMEALIKAFYGALFTFLVKRINASITVREEDGGRRRPGRSSNGDTATIGVLDIFGFESFKHNSFEQLCINYCNEALQQQFNLFVLKNEQAEYEKEGIKWSFISFPDNQEVLDLIDKKGCGIIPILDDQCRAPGTTDKTFCIDLYNKCTKHPRFSADFRQVGASLFGITHYAGPVEYSTAGFVEKNRDELPKEATELLMGSTIKLVQELGLILSDPSIGNPAEKAARSRSRSTSPIPGQSQEKKVTVGGQFARQLRSLRHKIDQTAPHYVRCLKPNDLLVPDHFNPLIISDQLRYAGVIEAVRVSRVGFPHRYNHAAFASRYKIMALAELKKAQRSTKRQKPVNVVVNAVAAQVWKIQCEKEREEGNAPQEEKKEEEPLNLIEVGIQIGKTKVFLRRNAYEILEQLRSGKNVESTIVLQRIGRGYIARRDFSTIRNGAIALQCIVRMQAAKALVHEKRLNYRATMIQSLWRKGVQHKQFTITIAVARWMQRVQRGRRARKRYVELNRERKAIVLQQNVRGWTDRSAFLKAKSAAVTIQCATRCRVARNEFRSMKLQARDLGSAVTERDNLRSEVQKIRRQLKESQAKLSAAESNSSSASTEELSAAEAKINELSQQCDSAKQELEAANASTEKERARADAAESAALESQTNAKDQLSRAEKYKKRFVEDHEELKKLKASMEGEENEVDGLKAKLAAANAATEAIKTEQSSVVDALKNELNAANERISEVEKDHDELRAERDELLEELETTSTKQNNQSNDSNGASAAELEAARAKIKDLEKKLITVQSDPVSSDDVAMLKRELEEVEEQAADDLKRKNEEINLLKKTLEVAQTSAAKPAPMSDSEMANEILTLQDEVTRLNTELSESKKVVPTPAAEIDPNSPEALARRYEELSRLAVAGLEKDREIEKLKAMIDDFESNEMPAELNNGEEVETLRAYIHELQTEIGTLRNQTLDNSDTGRSSQSSKFEQSERRGSQGGSQGGNIFTRMLGSSQHGPPSHVTKDTSTTEEAEERITELEAEVDALKEVNQMLRTDVETSRKQMREAEAKLDDERATSKRELESFAKTLRGVDELRQAAESMSRQVKQYQTVGPPGSGGRGFTDEMVEGDFEDAVKMIDSAASGFDAAGKKQRKEKAKGFWGIDLIPGSGKKEDGMLTSEDEDQFNEDVDKIVQASKKKRKKKKRRGSGSSIVSSFF